MYIPSDTDLDWLPYNAYAKVVSSCSTISTSIVVGLKKVFDNTMFKIIYALFIAYTVCIDPIYAILLTTFMIMVIQELHLRKSLSVLSNLDNNNSNKLIRIASI